ncbi:unnamed protein product, partial [Trichogramma brassicae]
SGMLRWSVPTRPQRYNQEVSSASRFISYQKCPVLVTLPADRFLLSYLDTRELCGLVRGMSQQPAFSAMDCLFSSSCPIFLPSVSLVWCNSRLLGILIQ